MPYSSKLILSQTDPIIDAAPMCFAAFVLAISVCQPCKVVGMHRWHCSSSFGSAEEAFSPQLDRPTQYCGPPVRTDGPQLAYVKSAKYQGRASGFGNSRPWLEARNVVRAASWGTSDSSRQLI